MSQSIASSIKENRRLVTFSMENPGEFVAYLKTRYNSEITVWFFTCKKNDWKYSFLAREWQIRQLEKDLRELAEVW